MKLISSLIGLVLFSMVTFNCEDPDEKPNVNIQDFLNTLDQAELGGATGHITDYFYDLNTSVDVEFYRFSSSYFTFDYEQYLNLFQAEPTTLSLQSFPEYLVTVTPNDQEYTHRTIVDSLTMENVVILDSIYIESSLFKNIESMVWDTDAEPEAQRYKPNNSDWISDATTVSFSDTMSIFTYRAVIDTPLINQGLLFVDQAEWVDTTYEYVSDQPFEFTHTFNFLRKQLSNDSLMFRVNTDCNDNNSWNDAETEDIGNGLWDPAEPFYDINGNGFWDPAEPFEDRNCNGVWNGAEAFTDANSNDQYDEGELFVDVGNGILDSTEVYTDLNSNGQPDSDELFIYNPMPNRLLVNWNDSNTSQVLHTIQAGDSLVTRWGQTYYNIIEEVEFINSKNVTVRNLDSLVTLYTNQIIANVENGGSQNEYFIVKTEWDNPNTVDRDYDYLLFKYDEHLYKLTQPSYFKFYGYYWSDLNLETGFWHKSQFVDEILYYTVNGLLREGEEVEELYYDTTSIAIYKIQKSFLVEVDDVIVPAKIIRGFINEDGNVECYANSLWSAASIDDCPGADTTFLDVFKITRKLTQTMIGTDVEFGELNTTWLAKGRGIVKDELQIRWSEWPGVDEMWRGVSRWELGKFTTTSNGSGQFAKLLNRAHEVKITELQNIPELQDPYIITRTSGLQRVELLK